MHVADLDIFPSIEHCWILDCYMTGLTLDCILFTDANGIFIGVLMSCICWHFQSTYVLAYPVKLYVENEREPFWLTWLTKF